MNSNRIVILGIFVVDLAFRAKRQPAIGETLIGQDFILGPGGKGSNQAVAAARLGSDVFFISKLGNDDFSKIALQMWERENVSPLVECDPSSFTGAAYIYVDASSGDNAIIVVPGAAREITSDNVDRYRTEIESSRLFMTQLETSVSASHRGLEIARNAGVTTVLNPAPAAEIDNQMMELCDFLIPNETEAELLTGKRLSSMDDALPIARELHARSHGTIILTLGEKGAFFYDGNTTEHVEARTFGPVVETTGAGDSFCGAFAHALIDGNGPLDATRFACSAAAISVTRPGTAPAMPTGEEVDSFHGQVAPVSR